MKAQFQDEVFYGRADSSKWKIRFYNKETLEAYGAVLNDAVTCKLDDPDDPESGGESLLPNGEPAFFCWGWANAAVEKFGGEVMGFWHEDNPTARICELEPCDGHNFALIGRYLVDYWATFGPVMKPRRTVYDLKDKKDKARVKALYGDPAKWTTK